MELQQRSAPILIAEDDADDRMMIMKALEQTGLAPEVEVVCDGEQLMDYLHRTGDHVEPGQTRRPSFILLDLNMPLKSGREALLEIKSDARLRTIPVVIFTTSSSDIDIFESYDNGANAYVVKPVSYKDLRDTIKAIAEFWLENTRLPERTFSSNGYV